MRPFGVYSQFKRQVLICLLFFQVVPCSATSVRAIDFAELCQQAGLIFEGQVASIEIREEQDPFKIWTIVTFRISSVIKGQVDGDTVELAFLGGTVGDLSLQVGEMRIPEFHESGIYFVESMTQRQPNPLLGWTQGHFLVETDSSNTKRVFSADRRPISKVNQPVKASQHGLSTGVVLGTEIADPKTGAQAISVEAFKRSINDQLGGA